MKLETKYYKYGGDTGITRYKNFEELSSCLRNEGFTDELKRENYFEIQSEAGHKVLSVSNNAQHRYFITDRDNQMFRVEKLSPLESDKDSMWKIAREELIPDKGWTTIYVGEVTLNGLMTIAQIYR